MKRIVSLILSVIILLPIIPEYFFTAEAAVTVGDNYTNSYDDGVQDPDTVNYPTNKVYHSSKATGASDILLTGVKGDIPWHGYFKFDFYAADNEKDQWMRVRFLNPGSCYVNLICNSKNNIYDCNYGTIAPLVTGQWYTVCVYINASQNEIVYNLYKKVDGSVIVTNKKVTFDFSSVTGVDNLRINDGGLYIDNLDFGTLPSFESYVLRSQTASDLKTRMNEYASYGAFIYPDAFLSLSENDKNTVLDGVFLNLTSYTAKSDFVTALSNEASVYASMFTDKYTENFESVTPDKPYGLFSKNGDSTIVEVASDGSLKLSNNSAMWGGKGVSKPKSVVYEFDYKTTIPGTYNIIGIRDTETDGRPWWYANATSDIEANQWYNIKWHINFTTNKAGLYIKTPDEAQYTCIYDGYNSSVLDNISLTYLYSPSGGDSYYDNFVVKEYNYGLSSSVYMIANNNISGVLETELVRDFLSNLTKSNRKTLAAKVFDSNKNQISDTMSEARYLRLEDTAANVELEYTIDVDRLYNIAFSSFTSDMENSNLVYGDGFSAKADFTNNTDEKQSVLLILAQYSSDCILKNVAHSSKDIAAESSGDIIVTPSFDMASGDYIKMYLWNKLTLAPYTIPQNIRTLSDATLFLIGDSIVTDYTAADYPQQGWGCYIGNYLDEGITIENHANGGWTTAHYMAPSTMGINTAHTDVFDNWKENIKKGDYVMISLGINDSGRVDETAYINYLDTMYTYATNKGAEVLFSTPTIYGGVKDSLDGWTYDTSNAWAARGEVCREFAQSKGALCIPLGAKLSEVYEEMYQEKLNGATDNASKIAARNAVRYYFHLYSSNLMDTEANGGFSMTELQLKSHPNNDLEQLGNDPTHYNERGANKLAEIIADLIVSENALQKTNCSLANRVK